MKSSTAIQTQAHERPARLFRSQRRLLYVIVLLGMIGLGIAGYLTYTHVNEAALICSTGGCETVQSSAYSTIGPLPIALLGVAMFGALLALAGLRIGCFALVSAEHASLIAWAMLLTGVLYYVYLTYVELFVLNAICQWCIASSLAAIAMFGLESVYFWRTVMSDEALEIE